MYGGNVQGGEGQHVNDLRSYVGGQAPGCVHYICALVSSMRLKDVAALLRLRMILAGGLVLVLPLDVRILEEHLQLFLHSRSLHFNVQV